MVNLSRLLCVALSVAALLSNCKGKDGDPGPAGPAGPALTGSIVGFVSPISEDGDNLNKAGVTVSITSVTPQLTQTTDANGRFEFRALKTGTYNFTFSRTGLATNKVFGFAHLGGEQPTVLPLTYITSPSQTSVYGISATAPQNNAPYGPMVGLNVSVFNSTATSPYRAVAVYASTSPNVSATTGSLLGVYYVYQNGSSTQTTLSLTRSRFAGIGIASGSTVYLVAYGAPYYANVSYTDPTTGATVLTGLSANPSSVVTTTAP